jgi:3-oxoadipate enol-lactonase
MPFVQTEKVTLFVTEAGPSDAPAILFSNSLGTTHRMWDAVVSELSMDFRCVRYDTRGHGASTRAKAPFHIDDLAADAIAILDNLGVRTAHFVGLSLGGMTGQALAHRHRDRLNSLTLMATSAFMPPAAAWLERAARVRLEGTISILDATLSRWFTQGFRASHSEQVKKIADEFATLDSEGYAGCCEAIAAMDLRPLLSGIHVPTSIVAGADDPATPVAMLMELHEFIPQSAFTLVRNAAHLLAVEQHEQAARHIRNHVIDHN